MIGTYTLTASGTVPEYVMDGGYFAVANDLPSPQDWTLVGVVAADAPVDKFAALADFISYLESIGAASWVDDDGAAFDYVAAATVMWDETAGDWVAAE